MKAPAVVQLKQPAVFTWIAIGLADAIPLLSASVARTTTLQNTDRRNDNINISLNITK